MQAIRHRHSLAAALEVVAQQKDIRTILRYGIVVRVSNPTVIVFFVAVLPQFVDRLAPDLRKMVGDQGHHLRERDGFLCGSLLNP